MAIGVTIDFDNVYEITPLLTDLKSGSFETILEDGNQRLLKIEIGDESHPLLPGVYNLAFGPVDEHGRIDDKVQLRHRDYSRVFSTILGHALTYLDERPRDFIGIDGSNNGRAFLYYRFIHRNYDYLSRHFNIWGLKYYVRITRFGKMQYDNPFDFDDIYSQLFKINKEERMGNELMYNYFVFNKK